MKYFSLFIQCIAASWFDVYCQSAHGYLSSTGWPLFVKRMWTDTDLRGFKRVESQFAFCVTT